MDFKGNFDAIFNDRIAPFALVLIRNCLSDSKCVVKLVITGLIDYDHG